MEEWDKTGASLTPEEPQAGDPERGADEPQAEEKRPKPREGARVQQESAPGRDLYMNIRLLVVMMTAFVFVFTFVARIIVVSGPSMQNTLHGGDVMLVWTLGYNNPKQGDVVVLTQRSYQDDSIVKRVIATEGQTVDIDYGTNTVYIDGVALEEDYIKERMEVPGYGEGLNHITVPEGCIFVMGDNRNQSADSRYPAIGIVDTRCIIGKGLLVLFPFSSLKGL